MHIIRQLSFGDIMQLTYYKQHILITNRQFVLQAHVRHYSLILTYVQNYVTNMCAAICIVTEKN